MLVTLVDRIFHLSARCVRIVAGAGWGKTAFVRTYVAMAAEKTAVIDCRGMKTIADFDAAVFEALRSIGNAVFGVDSVADWSASGHSGTILFDNLSRIVEIDHAVDHLRALLRTLPPERRVVLCSRVELPVIWSSYFAPHEMTAIGTGDLAIDGNELEVLLTSIEHSAALADRLLAVSHGWPIAVLLFVRLAANGTLETALDELADAAPFGDLHAYVQAEIFDTLAEHELEALCTVVALGGGTAADLSLACGRDLTRDLDGLAGRLRYLVSRERDIFDVMPLARATAEMLQRTRVRTIMRAAIDRFIAAGRFVRAAELALAVGDGALAARALDAAGSVSAGFLPSSAYLRTAIALGIDHLAHTKNVLTVLLAGNVPPPIRWQLLELVEARWHDLDENDHDTYLRTVLRIARAFLLRLPGRYEAALQSARGAERDIALLGADAPLARALHVVRATLAANFMRIADADAAWAASGEPAHAKETFFAADRVEFEIMSAVASADSNTIMRAYIAAMDDITFWHDEFGMLHAQALAAGSRFFSSGHLPESGAPGSNGISRIRFDADVELMQAGFDRAARFGPATLIDAALRQSDRALTLELLASATARADALGLPFQRVLTRVVAAAVNEHPQREIALAEAHALAPEPLRARVAELQNGILVEASLFTAFLHGPAAWVKTRANAACRIEIMRGQVIRHDDVVRLRDREHELLVALALAGGALSREALIDRLWPDQDEAIAAGSLRSTLHRLRQQLGATPFVVREGNMYKLAPDVNVDIAEAEALYNALRREAGPLGELERQRLEHQFSTLAYGVPETYTRWSWFTGSKTRLIDLRHGLGMLLARDDVRAGRVQSASRWTERLIELDPLDEVAAELHFGAIVRSGGRAEAARWLRRYRDLLAREYSMEPSFELDRAMNDGGLSDIA